MTLLYKAQPSQKMCSSNIQTLQKQGKCSCHPPRDWHFGSLRPPRRKYQNLTSACLLSLTQAYMYLAALELCRQSNIKDVMPTLPIQAYLSALPAGAAGCAGPGAFAAAPLPSLAALALLPAACNKQAHWDQEQGKDGELPASTA